MAKTGFVVVMCCALHSIVIGQLISFDRSRRSEKLNLLLVDEMVQVIEIRPRGRREPVNPT